MYLSSLLFSGKTSGVKFVCEEVIKSTKTDSDCRAPVLCYINAVSIKETHNPLECLFNDISFSVGFPSGSSASSLKSQLSRKPQQKFVILILDEIDALVSNSRLERRSKSELALGKLLDCAADETYPLALIGISNTIGSDKFERLHRLGQVRSSL